MTKPATLTAIGATVDSAAQSRQQPTEPNARRRFADVKAYSNRSMPAVTPWQVWEDLDPRCTGRRVQVVAVYRGRALVRTVSPRTCPPRTPSKAPKDTTGRTTWIALRRFRANSRGFRLLDAATFSQPLVLTVP